MSNTVCIYNIIMLIMVLSVKIKIKKFFFLDNYKSRFTKIQNEKEFRSQSIKT